MVNVVVIIIGFLNSIWKNELGYSEQDTAV